LASRLRALGGHVTGRMRRALHLGVQKALRVVRSHYEINFEAVAKGYIVPEGVEDEVAMERVDALSANAAGALADAFEEFFVPGCHRRRCSASLKIAGRQALFCFCVSVRAM
jgi:hypothetical protein